jgi:hypothetical protein
MELVRISRDAWGQQVLEGISWDLLPVAFALGAIVIIGHAIYRLIRKKHTHGVRT